MREGGAGPQLPISILFVLHYCSSEVWCFVFNPSTLQLRGLGQRIKAGAEAATVAHGWSYQSGCNPPSSPATAEVGLSGRPEAWLPRPYHWDRGLSLWLYNEAMNTTQCKGGGLWESANHSLGLDRTPESPFN